MGKNHWKMAAAWLLTGSLVFAAAGCGNASDVAKKAIGLDSIESRLASKGEGTSKGESVESSVSESTASGTESTDSKVDSSASTAESGDSKAESTSSKDESTSSTDESTSSKDESTPPAEESTPPTEESSTPPAEESTPPEEQPAAEKTIITGEGIDVAALTALDNTRYTAGYAPQFRDDLNRPQETVKLQEMFGSEKSEFLHGEDNTIHLVFTAGYTNESTNQILNVLKEKGVKATFFLTGYCMEDSPSIVQRIIDEGHTLGSHSYSHPTLGMQSYTVEQIIDDSMRAQIIVRDKYGYEMQYYSFPSGEFSQRALETIKAMGYHVIFDSFAYRDYDPADEITPDEALAALYAEMHVGEICQMHASSATSAAVLANFIDGARQIGFQFENYE